MRELDFSGQVVVVTNAAQGIGAEIVKGFAERGARVIGTDREPSRAPDAIAALQARGLDVEWDVLDVRVPAQSERLVERTVVDVWVNVPESAAAHAATPVEMLSTADWDDAIHAGLSGTFYCCRAAGKQMLARGRGVIVNVATVNGIKVVDGHAASATAEAGIFMLTNALGVEWAKRGVRVVAVAAGPNDANAPEKFAASGQTGLDPTVRVPLHRQGTGREIADAVAFVASSHAGFITAETVRVDGGWTAYQLF
jgi:NAD(P)-dependent dehydrogenase (short-subunit alcohol dehydrogenase family)